MKDQKNFWLYATGRLVSLVGTGIQDVALPLFILDATGSGTIMGTFMIITMVPRLIMYPVAGAVGDRVNRKVIMVSTDFGRGAVILFLAFLAAQNRITIPVLFGAQLVLSLMSALFGPATMAMLPDIVERENLVRANSTMGALNSFSSIVGPVLGGIIYGFGGLRAAFLINSISFIGSGVIELFITYEQKTRKFTKVREVLTDVLEGIHFVRTHRGLLIFLLFGLVVNFLINPLFSVLAPYVFRVVILFSSEQFGMVQTAFTVGILIGNIIIGTALAKKGVKSLLHGGLIIFMGTTFIFVALIFPQSIEYFGYASWAIFAAISLTYALMGVSLSFVNTPMNVELQKLAPTEFRARVFSVMDVITQGIVPVGFGVMGFLLDVSSAHVVALCVSVITLLVVVLFIFRLSEEVFRKFEHDVPS